jgi:serine protease Do
LQSTADAEYKIQLKLVGSDAKIDLALLQAADKRPSAVASFRDSDPTMGESVSVFGFPLPGVLSTSGNLTTGIVAATSGIGDDPHNLQISAPVQPGNSGGPLLDRYGNVIGVVVSKLNANEIAQVTGDIPQNVNFAIEGGEVLAYLRQEHVNLQIAKWNFFSAPTQSVATAASAFTVQIICVH